MTPYISVTSGLASDLRKDADCLKLSPEVRKKGRREVERKRKRRFLPFRERGTEKKNACFSFLLLTPSLSSLPHLFLFQACPVPLQFDYFFWNVTNPEAVRQIFRSFFYSLGFSNISLKNRFRNA